MRTTWIGGAGDPVWLKPWSAWPWLEAVSSGRLGGVSTGPYASLNVGLHVGDDPAAVMTNRARCAAYLGSDVGRWVFAEQVHGRSIAVVTQAHAGAGVSSSPLPGVDALVTAEPGVVLAIQTADCVPVLLADVRQRVVAVVHSGWRGTVLGITGETVRTMQAQFGTQPEDLYAWLGPSIRRCCYEVDERVAQPMRERWGEGVLWARVGHPGKWWLSLQTAIRRDLMDAGVPTAQIRDCGECTACRTPHFFSHRAEAGRTGRQLTAVRIRDGMG
ncbi:MAG: peptidoglycan editing factor PgeF [Thermoflavifilum sp.]|nr:peptidoglycan editing factor PgeF [Thermoflavifilum sp.]MCL6513281.1 peptidoglycan editing factor PgeF [Alicyclobacillus sp.]